MELNDSYLPKQQNVKSSERFVERLSAASNLVEFLFSLFAFSILINSTRSYDITVVSPAMLPPLFFMLSIENFDFHRTFRSLIVLHGNPQLETLF